MIRQTYTQESYNLTNHFYFTSLQTFFGSFRDGWNRFFNDNYNADNFAHTDYPQDSPILLP
ncbi:hypothetical protein [Bacteroides bouchesdurhonensis]